MTRQQAILELQMLLWQQDRLVPAGGQVRMLSPGTRVEAAPADGGCFAGAEAEIDGVTCRGTVLFSLPGRSGQAPAEAILEIVQEPSAGLTAPDGRRIPQLMALPGDDQVRNYALIRAGATAGDESPCAAWIRSLDPLKRLELFTRLYDDRVGRKHRELRAIWEEGQRDWNRVFYVMLFRAMGGSDFKEQYGEVAARVPYTAIAHEKMNRRLVEAMLLGASGLLFIREQDDYVTEMQRDFDYAQRKYPTLAAPPMDPSVWQLEKSGYVSPTLRLVQLSALLTEKDFLFGRMRECRTARDVYALLRVDISDYWLRHFPNGGSLGQAKIELLGINLVVPLMYAYSVEMQDEKLRETALDLIEKFEPESNRKTKPWRNCRVEMKNAHDSQAILELTNEYCAPGRCHSCPVGRNLLKNI